MKKHKINFLLFAALLFAGTLVQAQLTVSVTGETTVCGGESYQYVFHPDDDDDDYYDLLVSWAADWATSITPSLTDDTKVTIVFDKHAAVTTRYVYAATWSYYVPDENGDGNPEIRSGAGTMLAVTVEFLLPVGTISGPTSIYKGNTANVTYSVSAVPGAKMYTWTKPAGWTAVTPLSGATRTSITLTPDNTTGGSVCVEVTNTMGGCSLEENRCVTITRTVQPPVFASGPTAVCLEDYDQKPYTVSSVPNTANYEWQLQSAPATWWLKPGKVPGPLVRVLDFESTAGTGNICCRTESIYTGFSPWTCRTVQAFAASPGIPSWQAHPSDICVGTEDIWKVYALSVATSYTWSFEPIGGGATATGLLMTPVGRTCYFFGDHEGTYRIEVYASNECGDGPVLQTTVVVNDYDPGECGPLRVGMETEKVLSLQPNPANTSLHINIISTNENIHDGLLTLTNISGEIVYVENVVLMNKDNSVDVNTSALPAGIYMVNVLIGETLHQEKVVITH